MSKRRKNNTQNIWQAIVTVAIIVCILVLGYINQNTEISNEINNIENATQKENVVFDLSTIPEYSSNPYVKINNNIPYFNEEDY